MGDRLSKEKAIPLEKIVCINLSLEINLNFHIEAIKTQAIAIRTNLLKNIKSIEKDKLKEISQDEEVWKIAHKAVEETEGKLITFNGNLIDAKYHLTCGGSTENSENVEGNRVSYLRRVLCDYCQDSPYWYKEKNFTINELESLLEIKFPEQQVNITSDMNEFIDQIKRDEYNRVKSIKIGDKVFSGKELSKILHLDSTRFSIFPTSVKFISRGKGHGMGLCLYGANTMANEGYSYEDILKYYYTGIKIEKVNTNCIRKPLYGRIIMLDPGHGGEDIGFKGDSLGILEKDITLNICLNLKQKLEKLGAKIYLTRDKDEKILSIYRLEQANKLNPDFLVSVHMDYYPNSTMEGLELFYFKNDEGSKKLGKCILDSLDKMQIKTRGLKEGNFYMLRGSGTKSLIIDAGFLSNKDEEIKFNDYEYIERVAEGILGGISEYFKA